MNSGPLGTMVIEEIALEGLEGLTLQGLWTRLSVRLKLDLKTNPSMCVQIWEYVKKDKCVQFYELPDDRPPLVPLDRFSPLMYDSYMGVALEPVEFPFTQYQYFPVEDGNIRGSCEHYKTRQNIIRDKLLYLSLKDIENGFGNKLVIVADQTVRENLLIPSYVDPLVTLTVTHYCVLEKIGVSRYMGETTLGKYSLNSISSDPKKSFYYSRTLSKLKLIVKQPYAQKYREQNFNGCLFHLPRFFVDNKPRYMILTEKIVEFLKTKPNYMADYHEARIVIGDLKGAILKKLSKTADFTRFIQSNVKIPYRQLYPNAKKSEYMFKKVNEEKSVRAVVLIDPNIEVSDLWNKENDEEIDVTFLNRSGVYMNEPTVRQAYRALKEAKSVGLSSFKLQQMLGIGRLNCRCILKRLLKLKCIQYYIQDRGRQRVTTYILTEYIDKKTTEYKNDESALFDSLQNDEEAPLETDVKEEEDYPKPGTSKQSESMEDISIMDDEDNLDRSDKDAPINTIDINVTVEPLEQFPHVEKTLCGFVEIMKKRGTMKTLTRRILHRIRIIVRYLKTFQVVDEVIKLLKVIVREEKKIGYQDKICKKSMYRILSRMRIDNYVNCYNVILRHDTFEMKKLFLCDPSLDENHPVMKSYIDQAKAKFIMSLRSKMIQIKKRAGTLQEIKEPFTPEYNADVNYGYTPKFLRMRILHEFLYYIIYELPENTKSIDKEETLMAWREKNDNINVDELRQVLGPLYSTTIDEKMCVPPLTRQPPYGTGWVMLTDVLTRLPISVFVKIVNVNYVISGLEDILNCKIKKHMLVHHLPDDLRSQLLHSRKFIFNIDDIARLLCCIGLVQYGPARFSNKEQIYVYLNKKAVIYNTTPSNPAYCRIDDQTMYEQLHFDFTSSDEVKRYWTDLRSICLNTRLGIRKFGTTFDTPNFKNIFHRASFIKAFQPQTIRTAVENDVGSIPGDKRGAAGLDSSLYSHLKRNWNWSAKIKRKTPIALPRKRKLEANPVGIPYKKFMHDKEIATSSLRKDKRKNMPILKRITAKVTPKIRFVDKKKSSKRIRKPFYDDIDRMALEQMNKLRVEWTSAEDNILLLCKIGCMYFGPNHLKILIPYTVVRDILQWKTKLLNKTSRACQRRISFMTKNSVTMKNCYLCLEEVRSNKAINDRFGLDFLSSLKHYYKSADNIMKALKTHYIDLVALLIKYFSNLSSSKQIEYTIPDTLEEFHERHKSTNPVIIKPMLLYEDPKTRYDIDMYTIYLLIHSSMCCVRDKTTWNIQLFEIYKNYPDRFLTQAMNKSREHQMLALNKHAKRKTGKFLPLATHPFHLSTTYQYNVMTNISYEIFTQITSGLKYYFGIDEKAPSYNPWCNINESSCGLNFLLAEINQHEQCYFKIEVPKRILVLDPEKEKLDPLLERISKKFHESFSLIQKITDEQMECDTSEPERVSRIKFYHEADTMNYMMAANEKLMKFPDEYFHYFCLLVNPKIQFNFAAPDSESQACSPHCILTQPNFIELAIGLIESNMQPAPEIHETFNELIDNIILKKIELDKKDIGKLSKPINLKPLDLFNVIKEIEESMTDDYEDDWIKHYWRDDEDDDMDDVDIIPRISDQTIFDDVTKDDLTEKMRRLHDYFVVNSSRVFIKMKNELTGSDLLHFNTMEFENIIEDFRTSYIWPAYHGTNLQFQEKMIEQQFTNDDIALGIAILGWIEESGVVGITAQTLYQKFNCADKTVLQKIIDTAASVHLIMKAGVRSVTYIYYLCIQPWVINSYHVKRLEKESFQIGQLFSEMAKVAPAQAEDNSLDCQPGTSQQAIMSSIGQEKARKKEIIQLRTAPWIRVNGSLNRRVFDRYSGAVVCFLLTKQGISLYNLCCRFKFLFPVTMYELLKVLEKMGIVTLIAIDNTRASLFSSYQMPKCASATEFDTLEDIFVEAAPDASLRIAMMIGEKKYKAEFIDTSNIKD